MSERNRPTRPGPLRMGGFGPRGGPMMMGEKPKDFKGSGKKLLSALSVYKARILLVAITAVLGTVFNIAGPKVLARATNEIFNGLVRKLGGGPGVDFTFVGRILLIMLGLYLISAAFSFIQGWIMSGVSQDLSYSLRGRMSEKIHRMPMRYFEDTPYGEVLSRFTNDVDTLSQSLNQSITTLITSLATLIGVLVMMLSISPLMTLIALVILPVAAVLIQLIVKRSQKHFRTQQEYMGHINGQVEEVYGGHSVVRAFNHERQVTDTFNDTNRTLYHSAWRSQFFSGMMQPLMGFVGNLGYVAVALVGSLLAVRGTITVGDIQAFIQYVRSFTQPVTQIAQVSNLLQSSVAAAERVFAFLEEGEEDRSQTEALDLSRVSGGVTFSHVRFGYRPETVVIKDFSADIAPGMRVAIVGPTGAGKTTIVKLLMRFYDVDGGAILLDGHDVRAFDRGSLRGAFGMVLQDAWLFKGTILENIRYGKLDATDEEVYAAAKAARAHHFITTLPGGYQMELNEDATNLSQGQKQLLTIARALLADHKILILDEATSSVDTRTEILIQEAMEVLMRGRTSFVIAHRLSTIKNADLILVLDQGDIVEAGTHEALLEKDGFYAALYRAQFEQAG